MSLLPENIIVLTVLTGHVKAFDSSQKYQCSYNYIVKAGHIKARVSRLKFLYGHCNNVTH